MDMRALGGSGLETPRLVLGGNVFGWTVKDEEAFAILDRFAEAGGVMIDTADVYSAWVPGHKGGESESLIGEWLRRLGVETIDLYYAHQDDAATPLAETLAGFDRLVRDGKVRALGASNYKAERLAEALAVSEREGLARYEVLQPEYNLMARDTYEGALQALCVERNVGVLPYFGLASGFLTGKYRSEKDFGKSIRGGRMDAFLNDRGRRVLAALDEVAAEAGATPAQVALAWLAAQPGITAPIASATSVEQLEDLLGVLTLDLSADQVERLSAAA